MANDDDYNDDEEDNNDNSVLIVESNFSFHSGRDAGFGEMCLNQVIYVFSPSPPGSFSCSLSSPSSL